METLLLITVLLPLGAALLLGGNRAEPRWWALGATVASLVMAVVLLGHYPAGSENFAMTNVSWLAAAGVPVDVRFSIALDGLSLWLFGLTALLMVVAVLISWDAIRQQQSLYYRLLLVLETGMLGVFVARDIILFYLFFEFTLIPLFFLIGIWGSQERRYAAIKFFLFTLAGSVLTLLGLLAIVLWDYYNYHTPGAAAGGVMTFSIPELTEASGRAADGRDLAILDLPGPVCRLCCQGAAGAAAHLAAAGPRRGPGGRERDPGGRAAEGGRLRVRPIQPADAPGRCRRCIPWLLWLSVAGIIYGALVALAQTDLKRLIAYSSVSHLGFCMLGLFAVNRLAVEGGVLQMVNHGLSTGGLFALVGMIYERYHTRNIADLGGLARRTPRLAAMMVFMALASIGVPGLNGFAGEFLILLGMFQRAWVEAPAGLATAISRH